MPVKSVHYLRARRGKMIEAGLVTAVALQRECLGFPPGRPACQKWELQRGSDMAEPTFGASLHEAFCWHCDAPILRDGELSGFPFYVHLDGYGTCEPDVDDSTSGTPSPTWPWGGIFFQA